MYRKIFDYSIVYRSGLLFYFFQLKQCSETKYFSKHCYAYILDIETIDFFTVFFI